MHLSIRISLLGVGDLTRRTILDRVFDITIIFPPWLLYIRNRMIRKFFLCRPLTKQLLIRQHSATFSTAKSRIF